MRMAGPNPHRRPNRGAKAQHLEARWNQAKAFAQETGIMLRIRDNRFWYGPYSAGTVEEMRRVLVKLKVIAS